MLTGRRQKIAIIGSGISGLASAYLLAPFANVYVYEKHSKIGGHTRTLTINAYNTSISVDTGFIVFNKHNYPLLTKLFDHLDVEIQASPMSFSVSANNGNFEWGSHNLNSFFAQRSNIFKPSMWCLLKDITRFNRLSLDYVRQHPTATVDQLVCDLRLGNYFQDYYLMPMAAAIWSCTAGSIRRFPAQTLIQFLDNHGLLSLNEQPQWFTVKGGSQNYIDKLIPQFAASIRCGSNILRIDRQDQSVTIHTDQAQPETFDQVIFACHGDQILPLLAEPSVAEADLLSKFKFQKNTVYLHHDRNQMPKRQNSWSSWNYLTGATVDQSSLSVTYWMNLLQNIDHKYPLFVSLNPYQTIPDDLVDDVCDLDHPLFDQDAITAQLGVAGIQGQLNTWYCGAYLGYGFHEDGLRSAVNVALKLGATLPWQ